MLNRGPTRKIHPEQMKPVEPPQEPSLLLDDVQEPGEEEEEEEEEPDVAVQLPKAV